MKLRTALVTISLIASGGLLAAATPANADLVTRCDGTGGAVMVPNDLVVPAGKTCWLDGTTVQGDVTVRKGANLVISDGEIEGRVRVNVDAYFDSTGSTVGGGVGVSNAYGAYFDGSEVGAGVGMHGNNEKSFVYAFDSEVSGNVRGTSGEILLDGSTVGGSVAGLDTTYTDVFDSTISRGLRVSENEVGSVLCESEVDGNARYSGNAYGLQIGADGPITTCSGPSYFGRNLEISDNAGTIVVSDNIIRGDLSGTGNDPAPTGENNRVRGTASGQFENLPEPEAAPETVARTLAETPDHAEELAGRVDERRAAADAEATAAGKAQL